MSYILLFHGCNSFAKATQSYVIRTVFYSLYYVWPSYLQVWYSNLPSALLSAATTAVPSMTIVTILTDALALNPGVVRSNKFCTVVPNILWSSVCNILNVTALAFRILRLLLGFWKIRVIHCPQSLITSWSETPPVHVDSYKQFRPSHSAKEDRNTAPLSVLSMASWVLQRPGCENVTFLSWSTSFPPGSKFF